MIEKYITKTPGVCGGRACIVGTRIPLWILQAYRARGLCDSEVLETFPCLTREQLSAAKLYVIGNFHEILEDLCAPGEGTENPNA